MDYPGGPYDDADLQKMNFYIHEINPQFPLLEVGCWGGRSTAVLSQYAKEKNQIIYVIDPFYEKMIIPKFDYNMAFAFIKNMMRINTFQHVRLLPLTSRTASEVLGREQISILHLDGSHNYDDVKFEVDNFLPNVQNLLICHDIDFPDVKRALEFIPDDFYLVFQSTKMGIWKSN